MIPACFSIPAPEPLDLPSKPGLQAFSCGPTSADTARSFEITSRGSQELGVRRAQRQCPALAGSQARSGVWQKSRLFPISLFGNPPRSSMTLRSSQIYNQPPMTHEKNGAWLVVSDCITYLLYPVRNLRGSKRHSGRPGISVSNTVQGCRRFRTHSTFLTEEQSGSVTLTAFPKSVATVNGSGECRNACCRRRW